MSDANLLILLSTLSTGLILGAIFSLVAAGVTIVYGCVWLPNASNGQFFLLAALVAWSFTSSLGWNSFAASLAVIFLGVLLALALEMVLIRRLYDAPNRNVAYFVVTLGITQIMSGIFSLTYAKWSDQFSLPPIIEGITMIGPLPIQNNRLLVMAVSLSILVFLFLLLRFHPYGRALRAVFQNREAAALRGVNVRAIYKLSFVLGSTIIFLGGILFALAYSFDLTVAWTMSITAFAIMIIGGPGSVIGALVVGMTFGFTQAIVSIFASPTAATFSYLGAMLIMLLFRPNGLFKK
ncbi:MAG: branched-chain amino acid ABC transporter permease [Polaromonas sp.]|jgi:branched-subunit amino acid ABC-type transport system permease component|nr:branched-chain amino acid ABC transporter permease [Polaromonas sp.]